MTKSSAYTFIGDLLSYFRFPWSGNGLPAFLEYKINFHRVVHGVQTTHYFESNCGI